MTDETDIEATKKVDVLDLTGGSPGRLVLITDSYGVLVRVSTSSYQILGYEPEEMVGRLASDFLYPPDLDDTREEMRKARNYRTKTRFECRYRKKKGGVVDLRWSGVWMEQRQVHMFIGRVMSLLEPAAIVRHARQPSTRRRSSRYDYGYGAGAWLALAARRRDAHAALHLARWFALLGRLAVTDHAHEEARVLLGTLAGLAYGARA